MDRAGWRETSLAAAFVLVALAGGGFGQDAPPGAAATPVPGGSATAGQGAAPPAGEDPAPKGALVWGVAGLRGFVLGDQIAPNGQEFKQLFSLDLNFNCWLWPEEGLYLFSDTSFWGQKPGTGITNPKQGVFDFSKREMDLDLGFAWNYRGPWEARVFAYSFNNLNRGQSLTKPSGYADGVGLENRYYIGAEYERLGTDTYDVTRANFLSAGFFPTKDMTDGSGQSFEPGPFARAYLTWDLLGERCYLFADSEFICTRSFTPKLLQYDAGVAARPFARAPRWEFRFGVEGLYDLQWRELEIGLYGAIRLSY
jgi:hypothetical protein